MACALCAHSPPHTHFLAPASSPEGLGNMSDRYLLYAVACVCICGCMCVHMPNAACMKKWRIREEHCNKSLRQTSSKGGCITNTCSRICTHIYMRLHVSDTFYMCVHMRLHVCARICTHIYMRLHVSDTFYMRHTCVCICGCMCVHMPNAACMKKWRIREEHCNKSLRQTSSKGLILQ